MSNSRAIAQALALGMAGVVSAAQAAPADTGWVNFDLRTDRGNTYVYPRHSNGSWSYVFSGNCQFNGLVVGENGQRLHDLLLTAKDQGLRVSLGYDDTDGPVCRLAEIYIEWAD